MKKHASILLLVLLIAILTAVFLTAFSTSIREETEIIIETENKETTSEQTQEETTKESTKTETKSKTATYSEPKTTTAKTKTNTYTKEELYWLSRIISAESKGESMLGKLAVGTVIMNRVRSRDFPNTIYDVIFDTKHGVQFTPTANKTIYDAPSSESVEAAKRVLEGYRISTKVLYFVNDSISSNSWIAEHREYVMSVGNHKFFA